jgi:N utilization substance protein B
MALSHQKFREIVLQLLYSYDIGHPEQQVMIDLMMAELAVSKKNVRFAQEKVQKILDCLPQIDPIIASVSTSYSFDRIQTVTKNILRLGVFELFFEKESPPIPPKVVIAEAIRLSRKFNTPESASFVNALLDHLYQASHGEKIDSQDIEQQAQVLLKSETEATKTFEQNQLKLDDEENDLS